MTFPHLIEPLAVTGLVSAPAVISAARGRADTSASYQFLWQLLKKKFRFLLFASRDFSRQRYNNV
jgi:hypothetical protein